MIQRVIMLDLDEQEFESLLGHLKDDMAGSPNPEYWKEGRGKDIVAIVERMKKHWRRRK